MPKSIRISRLALALSITASAVAQPLAPTPHFKPVEPITFDTSGPVIRAHTEALKPFTVAGERGVILGQQDGTFESWLLPVKVLSHLTIEANVEGYSVPIDVNQQSAEIEVHPDRTVITYAHIAFTVRQIMFSPESGPAGTGPVVLFQFDCLHPTEFTFRFTPNLEFMWPMRNEGHPGPEWIYGVDDGKWLPGGINGYYVVHADYPDLAAAITIPDSMPGILAPYQERPQVHPVELRLRIVPERGDNGKLYPLLMAVGTNATAANSKALGDTLLKLNDGIASLYAAHAESYKKLLANSVSIETPDKDLNEAFQWAVVSIEQLKAKPWIGAEARATQGSVAASGDETGLVAGYYASGDSARPGFGWFFGRDSLYTLYAVNGYGGFALARSELEFLIRRQRADGKIMHEYSQTAPAMEWQQFPYMYAAADSTPLFLLAMLDYVRASGDVDFLKSHRDAVEKAWAFETGHADANGIYDNRQGTGWVESWPGGMPHQEIYLALLDEQASIAYGDLERLLGSNAEFIAAEARAGDISSKIESEFYDQQKGCYAFSRNADGSLDRTTTVYPALAWWSSFPPQPLMHGDQCLQQLAGHALNTDWGLRDVSNEEKIYDGMSYHQGSVWPLFTGWAALAEYRGGQPLAGYQMLMENANLTKAQDLGAVTELLSGDYFVPFGRSTSHQLWSSAMVITPVLRGLFGIDVDATTKTITVNPRLPAGWKHATVLNLHLLNAAGRLDFYRREDSWEVILTSDAVHEWHLKSDVPGSRLKIPHEELIKQMKDPYEPNLLIPFPAVEIEDRGFSSSSTPGARTERFRVLHTQNADRKMILIAEGPAGSQATLQVYSHGKTAPTVQTSPLAGSADFPEMSGHFCNPDSDCKWLPLLIRFPPGEGWKTVTVTLTW